MWPSVTGANVSRGVIQRTFASCLLTGANVSRGVIQRTFASCLLGLAFLHEAGLCGT